MSETAKNLGFYKGGNTNISPYWIYFVNAKEQIEPVGTGSTPFDVSRFVIGMNNKSSDEIDCIQYTHILPVIIERQPKKPLSQYPVKTIEKWELTVYWVESDKKITATHHTILSEKVMSDLFQICKIKQ